MKICEHESFEAQVDVNRLSAVEGGPVTNYSADVRICCAQCREPFRFIGVDTGLSGRRPMVNVEATELRAPIYPGKRPIEEVPRQIRFEVPEPPSPPTEKGN